MCGQVWKQRTLGSVWSRTATVGADRIRVHCKEGTQMWQMNVTEKLGRTCVSYLDADFPAWNLVLGNIYRDSHLEERRVYVGASEVYDACDRAHGNFQRDWDTSKDLDGKLWVPEIRYWERRPCMCPASVLASSLDTPPWLFSPALEEAAALETTGLWQALDGYFEGWSGPGWKFSCWLWCPRSSFRIPSCWEGFLFLLFSFPSSPQIFTYTLYGEGHCMKIGFIIVKPESSKTRLVCFQ